MLLYATSSPVFVSEYYLKDHLGNTRVSFLGKNLPGNAIEITGKTDYYPFGLAMSQYSTNIGSDFSKNKYLYNGKEIQDDKLNDTFFGWLDYGARFYDAQIGRWHSVDGLAERYNSSSPYEYCGNNPIVRIDIDGNTWTDAGQAWADRLDQDMTNQINSQNDLIDQTKGKINNESDPDKKKTLEKKLARQESKLAAMNSEFAQVRTELAELGKSSQMYNVVEDESLNAPRSAATGQANGDVKGKTVFNSMTGFVDIRMPSLDNQLAFFAHESKHAYQFETGQTSIKIWDANGEQGIGGDKTNRLLYDWSDEQAAYNRGANFGGEKAPRPYQGIPTGAVDFKTYTNGGNQPSPGIFNPISTAKKYNMAFRINNTTYHP